MSSASCGVEVTATEVIVGADGSFKLPSTLWPDCVPSSAWVRSASVLGEAVLVIVPVWGLIRRLPTRVRSWSPIQMPSSSSSLDTTV